MTKHTEKKHSPGFFGRLLRSVISITILTALVLGITYTVKQLAKIAGISVRTLHYYDELGLLKPSFIQENGYRSYEDSKFLHMQTWSY